MMTTMIRPTQYAVAVLASICLFQGRAETGTNVSPDQAAEDPIIKAIGEPYRQRMRAFNRPVALAADPALISKTAAISNAWKLSSPPLKKSEPLVGKPAIGATNQVPTLGDIFKAPQTLDEATTFLCSVVSMAHFPTKCFEHDGVFFFSGGTSAGPIDDFSSGFAIHKGDTAIYMWEKPSLPKTNTVK
jgi:hypothetical protein